MPDPTKTRVYLDTEFTSLNRSTCKLISLALVVFEGPELYIELTDAWVESDCSEFVRSTVLPQLDIRTHGHTTAEARLAVQAWFGQFESVVVFTDALQWDWLLLAVLCGDSGVPSHVALGEIETELLDCDAPPEAPHHALQDARMLARMIERSSRLSKESN